MLLRKLSAVDPTSARSAAVDFQILKVADLLAIFDGVTIDLFQNFFDVRFVVNSTRSSVRQNLLCVSLVIPRQIQETLIALSFRIGVPFSDFFAEVIDEP